MATTTTIETRNCHPTELKLFVRLILEEYVEECTIVYVVSSKTKSVVGSVFVIEGASLSWTLHKLVSVWTAKVLCSMVNSSIL